MKRILPALLIAASFSLAASPADAGRLKEAVRKAGEKAVIKSLCVADKLSGRGTTFLCR
jgi:hypothetical protein